MVYRSLFNIHKLKVRTCATWITKMSMPISFSRGKTRFRSKGQITSRKRDVEGV